MRQFSKELPSSGTVFTKILPELDQKFQTLAGWNLDWFLGFHLCHLFILAVLRPANRL